MTTEKINQIAGDVMNNCSIEHDHDGGFACLSALASEQANSECTVAREGGIWDARGHWWDIEKTNEFYRFIGAPRLSAEAEALYIQLAAEAGMDTDDLDPQVDSDLTEEDCDILNLAATSDVAALADVRSRLFGLPILS